MDQSRVLLVDDDTDILEINKAFLEGEGYEVSTATSIAQTMEKVQTYNFDCIVLDVMLPDGSAFELPPNIPMPRLSSLLQESRLRIRLQASSQVLTITSQSPTPCLSFHFVSTLISDVT